jgi:hypothetical protein
MALRAQNNNMTGWHHRVLVRRVCEAIAGCKSKVVTYFDERLKRILLQN